MRGTLQEPQPFLRAEAPSSRGSARHLCGSLSKGVASKGRSGESTARNCEIPGEISFRFLDEGIGDYSPTDASEEIAGLKGVYRYRTDFLRLRPPWRNMARRILKGSFIVVFLSISKVAFNVFGHVRSFRVNQSVIFFR